MTADPNRYQAECQDAFAGSPAERWFEKERGITPETCQRFGIGYDKERAAITFPYWNGLEVHRIKYRGRDSNQWWGPGDGLVPFGLPTLDGQPRVFLSEGESDTLRLAQELPEEAVLGIPGAASIACVEEHLPKGAIVYAVFDTDVPGRQAAVKAVGLFGARIINLPAGIKDVCEYFQAGHTRSDFEKLIAAADALEVEADNCAAGLLNTVAEAQAGATDNEAMKQALISNLRAATGGLTAYEVPLLAKLQGQPQGLLKASLPALAQMRPLDYGRIRKRLAKDGGVSAKDIDAEVIPLRPKHADPAGGAKKGSEINFEEPEPWPQEVYGAVLLDGLADTFRRFLALPEHGAAALALWTIFSHSISAFYVAPILALLSPEKQCGKSSTLDIIRHLCRRPLASSSITPAAMFRAIEQWKPTLLVDEADAFLKKNEELRGVINSGHTRGSAYVIRAAGDGADLEPRVFSTWSAKVIAMIGQPPDTIEDRSVIISLRRKGPAEEVERLRLDTLPQLTEELRRKAARWAADNLDSLKAADPEMPELASHRAADNWRPLIAIADAAGGDWPKLARGAAEALSGTGSDDSSVRVQLLSDIRQIFEEKEAERLFSSEIVEALNVLEDRPWPEWRRGLPLTPAGLARLLKPFHLKPKKLRLGSEAKQGYEIEEFSDAFGRYLPSKPEHPEQSAYSLKNEAIQSGTPSRHVPV